MAGRRGGRWCGGTVVRWCGGAVVRWCVGAVVRWCSGAVVHRPIIGERVATHPSLHQLAVVNGAGEGTCGTVDVRSSLDLGLFSEVGVPLQALVLRLKGSEFEGRSFGIGLDQVQGILLTTRQAALLSRQGIGGAGCGGAGCDGAGKGSAGKGSAGKGGRRRWHGGP